MSRLAIEINGAGLIVANDERVLADEPGYAIVDAGQIVTGSAAYAQARLKPARLRSGFWSALRVEGDAAESSGELAFEHLRAVWSQANEPESSAILVVPGSYDAQQLGLVLGIAHECGIAVEALVDTAVAASALRYPDRELLYVDATLRTATVTRVDQSGAAALGRFEKSDKAGLAAFTDEMVKAIAHRFVLETRFDPLHDAGTEQALYDGLPRWLDALHSDGAVHAEIEYAGEKIAVELTTERLRSASLRLFREIAQLIGSVRTPGTATVVQLNNRLARLPGLCVELERIDGVELTVLAHGAPAQLALQRIPRGASDGQDVRLLRRLPFLRDAQHSPSPREPAQPASERALEPTHCVFDGIVYRLDHARVEIASAEPTRRANGTRTIAIGGSGTPGAAALCVLERGDGGIELVRGAQETIFVNDERVTERRSLAVGDVVRIGESAAVLHIVAMEP